MHKAGYKTDMTGKRHIRTDAAVALQRDTRCVRRDAEDRAGLLQPPAKRYDDAWSPFRQANWWLLR